MVYQIKGQDLNKTALINGYNGKYGVANRNNSDYASIFGQNAISNNMEYITKELGRRPIDYNNPPAFNFEVQYAPNKNPDSNEFKTALLAAANEDFGGESRDVNEMTAEMQKALNDKDATTEALDLNKDGKIDASENAAYTLLEDALDGADPTNPQVSSKNIDGKFTKSGQDNSMFIFAKKNVENNRELLKQIYDKYNLGEAAKQQAAPAAAKQETSGKTDDKANAITGTFKNNQTIGQIVLDNREALSKEYGTNKLWGQGGLVDMFAKSNGFKGVNDPKLSNFAAGHEYNFKVK